MVPAARKAAIMRESFAKASSKVLTSAAVNGKVVSQSEDREGARSRNSARPAWLCRRGRRLSDDFRCWHETDMPAALRNVRSQGQSGVRREDRQGVDGASPSR